MYFRVKKRQFVCQCAYRIEVGLFGGNDGLPFKPYGVRGVSGKAGVSGRGEPANDASGSVSDRYDENDSSRTYSHG